MSKVVKIVVVGLVFTLVFTWNIVFTYNQDVINKLKEDNARNNQKLMELESQVDRIKTDIDYLHDHTIRVTVRTTVYQPEEAQCDSTQNVTAWNLESMPGLHCAVSSKLREDFGITLGDKVFFHGLRSTAPDGGWIVADKSPMSGYHVDFMLDPDDLRRRNGYHMVVLRKQKRIGKSGGVSARGLGKVVEDNPAPTNAGTGSLRTAILRDGSRQRRNVTAWSVQA